MKKFFLIALVSILFSMTGTSQTKQLKDMMGRWDISGEENMGAYLDIIDSTTIILNYMGEKRKITDYTIDFTKSPAWFDFSTKDNASILRIQSLLEMTGNDTIKWQLFVDEERPDHFSATKGELFQLRKDRSISASALANN